METKMGTKWGQNGDQMETKWRQNEDKRETNGDKMETTWRQNGYKMNNLGGEGGRRGGEVECREGGGWRGIMRGTVGEGKKANVETR